MIIHQDSIKRGKILQGLSCYNMFVKKISYTVVGRGKTYTDRLFCHYLRLELLSCAEIMLKEECNWSGNQREARAVRRTLIHFRFWTANAFFEVNIVLYCTPCLSQTSKNLRILSRMRICRHSSYHANRVNHRKITRVNFWTYTVSFQPFKSLRSPFYSAYSNGNIKK